MKERMRQREIDNRQKAKGISATPKQPTLETVSAPKWEGAEAGEVDESELERRQRAISEQLEKKQREVLRQGRELERIQSELKALEQPIKAEIMMLREKLEHSNRREKALVDNVNSLRKDLYEKEKGLTNVRAEKQRLADDLIRVMADYERRKRERLNQIAELVGDDPVLQPSKSTFTGF